MLLFPHCSGGIAFSLSYPPVGACRENIFQHIVTAFQLIVLI